MYMFVESLSLTEVLLKLEPETQKENRVFKEIQNIARMLAHREGTYEAQCYRPNIPGNMRLGSR